MTGRFDASRTPLSGLILLKRKRLADDRGHLSRLFDAEGLTAYGWLGGIAQVNETVTLKRGTARGFHFQKPPVADAKLVTCLRGAVLDVAVDIRKGSPTFLQHFAAELTADNCASLLIPEGFAHGFQALSDDVQLLYAHSAPYQAESEGALNLADPRLGVDWPLPLANLSERDRTHPLLGEAFEGIEP
ncbi:dTDP-4-dehydrorhamnose 3,5-epimerase family protein [Rhizobium sp. TRM95796]|uniref:dTDP-4-dehydrorhamnose 3,5-epimerase family protein n=1 Tax=Rhizobium sp. TRM95796 TaxID=2979862 RepID=UPI0021E75E9E|nr:dTDP-4-dehydrorhamnose 3,5-epimerase family protein [Rhizobium sp. TRM95796]MCV3766978.1 dTDP-4-dehydrorhamnose 3,5-epimerase family protein [Rhizobium sp. TRM95796]